ncbi:MAG: DUF1028 domain-containing protein [Thiothrix sp.]|nr:MAG: DUF1028 domain-containing protein [Thiothrix sp.]
MASTKHAAWRQLILVGQHGKPVIYTGEQTLGIYAQAIGEDCAAVGNLLAHAGIPLGSILQAPKADDYVSVE